ncbi:MAG: putative toxin-antitoxin system toxin component, PIN family [Chloroflexi bacterium]|nr:putative toxin-antitoxin system toxin component, PIN family [Chloroflexota bacterium]
MNYSSANKPRHRVFLDANTLISGLFYEGPESTLLQLGLTGIVELITCTLVIDEIRIVIQRKFPECEPMFSDVTNALTIIKTEDGKEAEELIRDRKDAPILASALKAYPDYLVTGDKDFHTPEIKKRLNVVTTKELLAKII